VWRRIRRGVTSLTYLIAGIYEYTNRDHHETNQLDMQLHFWGYFVFYPTSLGRGTICQFLAAKGTAHGGQE
jgi:hypothetical protein